VGCNSPVTETGDAHMLHNLMVVLFATTAGFTASGIIANIYRLIVKKAENPLARIGYIAVMVVAGPTVLFDNAARTWRAKGCSSLAFWLATAISGYWSFALGLFVIQIALAL
jgi:hypothetical protein